MSNKWLLALIPVLLVVIYRQLLGWDPSTHYLPPSQGWFFMLSESSPLYVLAFTAGLVMVNREKLLHAAEGAGDKRLGLIFMLTGGALFAWGRFVNAPDFLFLSLIFVILGIAGYWSGKTLVNHLIIPALILALSIPPPAVIINQIVFPFQLWTAEHTAWLMNNLGITAFPRGDYIILSHSEFRVAESCTALGFIKWLGIFALAHVYLFPASRLHNFLFICISPFIAYGVNLFRAMSLILSPGIEILSLHTFQGIAFFLIAFVLLHLFGNLISRITRDNSTSRPALPRDTPGNMPPKPAAGNLLASLAILMMLSIAVPRWPLTTQDTAAIHLPDKMGDWKFVQNEHKAVFLGTTQYTQFLYRSYTRGDGFVYVLIGKDDRLNRYISFMSPKNVFPDAIGLTEENGVADLGPDYPDAASKLSYFENKNILSYYWYTNTDGVLCEILRASLALDQSPFRRPGYGVFVRVDTWTEPTEQGRLSAEILLKDFISHMDIPELTGAPQ